MENEFMMEYVEMFIEDMFAMDVEEYEWEDEEIEMMEYEF